MYVSVHQPGLIVTDAALKLHAFNAEAVQILTFPEASERIQNLSSALKDKIPLRLFDRSGNSPVCHLKSGRRTYVCRAFPMNMNAVNFPSERGAVMLLLERKSNGAVNIETIAGRFALTERERETVKLLLEGLTSKEIATRMSISPHTVNAFVRLIMVKMGVSNRSGIVGKIACHSA